MKEMIYQIDKEEKFEGICCGFEIIEINKESGERAKRLFKTPFSLSEEKQKKYGIKIYSTN